MPALALMFVGAVLLVNGATLLGLVDARAAAPTNVFVGALLLVVGMRLALPVNRTPAAGDARVLLQAAGFFLFGFTYLYVAILAYTGAAGTGLGWYALWAAGVAAFLAAESFGRLGDPRFGVLWLLWTLLFAMFFAVLALDRPALARATGWLAIAEGLLTTSVPGALQLTGSWGDVPVAVVVATGVAVAGGLVALLLRTASAARAARIHSSRRTPSW